MEQKGNGTITAGDLMQRLVSAKKIINKVETGDYETGNIDESILRSDPDELARKMQGGRMNGQRMNEEIMEKRTSFPMPPSGPPNVQRIRESKLPDAIKQAMIDHPIDQPGQISLTDSLDMDFVKKTKKLMENDGVGKPRKKEIQSFASQRQAQKQTIREESYQEPMYHQQEQSIDMNAIAILIENTVRKVLDEKLTQLLSAQQTMSINENLVLKVGNSIFKGKITGVNKV